MALGGAGLGSLAATCAFAAAVELTLDTAVARALEANRALGASRHARDDEELALLSARSEFDWKVVPTSTLGRVGNNVLSPETSGLNGSVGAQLRKRFGWGTVISIGPSYNRSGNASNTTVNASLQQPMASALDEEVVFAGVHRATFNLATSERAYRQARVRLALEVAGAYHEAIRQEQLARANEALSDRLRRHTLIAGRKEKAGLSGPSDTFRAQIRLKDAEGAANLSRAASESARGRLRQALSLPSDSDLRLTDPPEPSWNGANGLNRALDHAPELRQLRDEIEEARRASRIAAAATRPDVSLNVSYGNTILSDALLQSLLPATQRQWSVYLQAGADLNRTAEKLNHRRALMRIDQLQLAYEDKAADVRRQFHEWVNALESAVERIHLREEQIVQAEGKLSIAQVKFAHDMADNFELIEAETDLQRARAELAAARMDRAGAAFALKAMTGQFP